MTRIRTYKTVYGTSEAAVIEAMQRQQGHALDGLLTTSTTPTVAAYLNTWYETYADEWAPKTRKCYRGSIDRFLIPAFGPLRLEQLTPVEIQNWLNRHKTTHGPRRRIELAHAVLRSALAEAKRLGTLKINSATLQRIPKRKKREITPLDVTQAKPFWPPPRITASTRCLRSASGVGYAKAKSWA